MKRKNFRVPNRDIKIENKELLFIHTKCFQRLYNIKQLGLANLVFPFATHTRGAHCLDCLDMSQRFIDALKENIERSENNIEKQKFLDRIKEDTPLIRATALLHDIMHIPYAHTLEDENGILEKGDKSERIDKMISRLHEELEMLKKSPELTSHILFGFTDRTELEKEIKKAQELLEDVKKVLWTMVFPDEYTIEEFLKNLEKKKGLSKEQKKRIEENIKKKRLSNEKFYIADIIGNTISADLLSYILRDVDFTGIEIKPGFLYRFFDYIELRQNEDTEGKIRLVIKLTKKGEWRHDILDAIINILNVRFALTEAVIYHHAKCAASAMLGKLAYLCNLTESDELYDIGDEGLMRLLEEKIDKMSKDSQYEKRVHLGARRLLASLKSRRFYKRFHIVTVSKQKDVDRGDLSIKYSFPQNRVTVEEEIEKKFDLLPGSILIFCPTSEMALKEADALVVYEKIGENGELKEVVEKLNSDECLENLRMRHPSLAERVRNVVDQYKALWKLYVFIDPSLIPIYGEVIKKELLKKGNIEVGDDIFDHSYVYSREEYKVSKILEEKVRISVPDNKIPDVFQKIPAAIEQVASKGARGDKVKWIKERAHEIVTVAIHLMNSHAKQRELPL